MKRFALKLALFLLLGAILNVAVACTSSPSRNSEASQQPITTSHVVTPEPVSRTGRASSNRRIIVVPIEKDLVLTVPRRVLNAVEQTADQFGPGQTIVLVANTDQPNGEQVVEWITECRTKHHVIIWIVRPSVRAFYWGMYCDERYVSRDCLSQMLTNFPRVQYLPETAACKGSWPQTRLTPGSNPGVSPQQLAKQALNAAKVGSYDVDPESHEIRFRSDLRGQYIFSPQASWTQQQAMLVLQSVHVVRDTADDFDELAHKAGDEEWWEISDVGRKGMQQWVALVEECEPLILEMGKRSQNASAPERVRILHAAIQMWRRCPEVAGFYLPPPEMLESTVNELTNQDGRTTDS